MHAPPLASVQGTPCSPKTWLICLKSRGHLWTGSSEQGGEALDYRTPFTIEMVGLLENNYKSSISSQENKILKNNNNIMIILEE